MPAAHPVHLQKAKKVVAKRTQRRSTDITLLDEITATKKQNHQGETR
jgi:hypothetical protein